MSAGGAQARQWRPVGPSPWQNHVVVGGGEPCPFGDFQGDPRSALCLTEADSLGLLSDDNTDFLMACSGESELDLGALSSAAGSDADGDAGASLQLPNPTAMAFTLDQLMGPKVMDPCSAACGIAAGQAARAPAAACAGATTYPRAATFSAVAPPTGWSTDHKVQNDLCMERIIGPVVASAPTNRQLPRTLEDEIFAALPGGPPQLPDPFDQARAAKAARPPQPVKAEPPAAAGGDEGDLMLPSDVMVVFEEGEMLTVQEIHARLLACKRAGGRIALGGYAAAGKHRDGDAWKRAMAQAGIEAVKHDGAPPPRPRRRAAWPSPSPADPPTLAVPAPRGARRRGGAVTCTQLRRSPRSTAAEAAAAAAAQTRAAAHTRARAAATAESETETKAAQEAVEVKQEAEEEPMDAEEAEERGKPRPRQRARKRAPPPPAPDPSDSEATSEGVADGGDGDGTDSSDEMYEPDPSEEVSGGGGGRRGATASSASSAREGGRRDVTWESLAALFDLPMNVAAAALGKGPTSLKKVCRRLGIQRWPQRQRRSLADLRDQLLGEAAGGGDGAVSAEEREAALAEIAATLAAGATEEPSEFLKRVRQKCFKHKHVQRKRGREGEAP